MQDILLDALKKECGDLYERGFTIVRTVDGKFEHMPWEKVIKQMERISPDFVSYEWSFRFTDRVTLWRDEEGKVYAGTRYNEFPSDCPYPPSPKNLFRCKPIYFEELSSEIAEKLIKEVLSKREQREREIALRATG